MLIIQACLEFTIGIGLSIVGCFVAGILRHDGGLFLFLGGILVFLHAVALITEFALATAQLIR